MYGIVIGVRVVVVGGSHETKFEMLMRTARGKMDRVGCFCRDVGKGSLGWAAMGLYLSVSDACEPEHVFNFCEEGTTRTPAALTADMSSRRRSLHRSGSTRLSADCGSNSEAQRC
jgi:hypothetical protein